MKHSSSFLLALLAATILSSCSGYVYFSKPQPAKVKKMKSFPESWRGDYTSSDDSISISKKNIHTVTHSIARYGKNDLVAQNIRNDIDAHPKERESRYTISGDTMIVDTRSESFEKIGRKNVVKPFGDKLALNQHTNMLDSWNTIIAEKKSDGTIVMYVAHLDSKYFSNPPGANDSLAMLGKISPIKPVGDNISNTNFICDPTPEQLQQLFDKGLFKTWAIYRKVK